MNNPFKEFIANKRKIEVNEPYIVINIDLSPKLNEYIQILEDIKEEDGQYHKYCGEVSKIINNFMFFWTEVIDDCVKEIDLLRNTVDKTKLLELVENTIAAQKVMHETFSKAFLPVQTKEEQNAADEIEALYEDRKDDLKAILHEVTQYSTQGRVNEFLDFHLDLAIRKKQEIFVFTQTNIAQFLLRNKEKIRISLEEILLRMRNNLKQLTSSFELESENLVHKLYEANKDRILALRLERHRTTEIAEVDYQIEKILDSISKREPYKSFHHLEEEVSYWKRRLEQFDDIEKNISKLQNEINRVSTYLKHFDSKSRDQPAHKPCCFDALPGHIKIRLQKLEEMLLSACRALFTLFAVRGQNRVYMKDKVGTYSIDCFGHKVYFFDHGSHPCHIKCDGSYVQYSDSEKYYYDKRGRYVLDDKGEKLYQIAPCTSLYKLNDEELLEKVTKDCGHSEVPNPDCKMNIEQTNKIEIFPTVDPLDIKRTLTPEVVKYLWDSLGSVLPDALYDTAVKQSHNPIYDLAHSLLDHKYHKNTLLDMEKKKLEAEKFRAEVYKKRFDRDLAASKAWKAKQVPKPKPEESDDTEYRATVEAQQARLQLARQMTYYDDY